MMVKVIGVGESLSGRQLNKGEGKRSPGQGPMGVSISALGVGLGFTVTKGHSEDSAKCFWTKSSGLSSALGLKVSW